MIIAQLRAGMWNQMFQYAFAKALAKKKNTSIKLDLTYLEDHGYYKKLLKETPRNFDLDAFQIHDYEITTKTIHNFVFWPFGEMKNILGKLYNTCYQKILWVEIIREEKFGFNRKYLNNNEWDKYIIWYRQSYRYFESISDDLKKEFVPSIQLDERAQKLLTEIINSESICINIRRSDYITDNLFYVQQSSYYQDWVKMIYEKLWKNTEVKIFIFSDDNDWCKNNIQFDWMSVTYVDGSYWWPKYTHYMRLMWHGKHFIWANSSFCRRAIWQHWNDDKIIVLPKNRFTNSEMLVNDLIPDYWNAIRI